MALKFAQVTASLANFTTGDALLGVQSLTSGGGNDRLFSLPQLASSLMSAPVITGHATIEGVLLAGATGTGNLVLDHLPTIGTATINNSTLGTATINNSTLGTATLNVATINTGTLNNPAINTATINTSTLNSPVINTATINAPVINNPALSTATINTGTLNNVTINTATLSNVTVNTATINNATLNTASLGTATINNSAINTATISNSTIGTAIINNSTLGTATLNSPALNTATINTGTFNNATLNTATINTGTLNNVRVNPSAATTGFILQSNGTLLAPSWAGGMVLLNTITANQLGSAVDITSLTSTFSRYRIAFENICPVSTATLTCSLNLQVATSGTSWIAASYISNIQTNVGLTTVLTGTTSLFYLSGVLATTCVGTSTLYGVNGIVDLINPANTVFRKSINGYLNYMTPGAVSTVTHAEAFPSGFWDGGTNAISGINIAFQTGNIATGTIRIYGMV